MRSRGELEISDFGSSLEQEHTPEVSFRLPSRLREFLVWGVSSVDCTERGERFAGERFELWIESGDFVLICTLLSDLVYDRGEHCNSDNGFRPI